MMKYRLYRGFARASAEPVTRPNIRWNKASEFIGVLFSGAETY